MVGSFMCTCGFYFNASQKLSAGAPTIIMREAMEGEEDCDISIVAKVSGCPFPTLTWKKATIAKPEEKTDVKYDQHMNKLVTQDKCTLLIQRASRDDSAIYSLTASNSLGSVTKDLKLLVLGINHLTNLLTICSELQQNLRYLSVS